MLRKKLSVNDAYSDSENECDSTENLSKDTVQKYQDANCEPSEKSELHVGGSKMGPPRYMPGDYVIVRLSAKRTEYRYAAIFSGDVDEDECEIKVTFLKLCGTDATVLTVNNDDVGFISLDPIICALPISVLTLKGNRYTYLYFFCTYKCF